MQPATPTPPSATARRFASRGALLFAARLLPALAVLIVTLLLARRLDREAYGHYQNFWVRYMLLTAVSCLGFPAFAVALSCKALRGWISWLKPARLAVYAGLMLVLGAAFALWEDGVLPFWLPPVFLVVYSVGILAEGFLLAGRWYFLPLICNAGFAVCFAAVHWLWRYDGNFLPSLFIALLVPGIIRTAILLLGCHQWRRRNDTASRPPTRSDNRLWLQLGIHDVVQQAARVADKALVSFLVPASLSAVYFNGAQEVPFLPLLLGAAGGAVLQQATISETTTAEENAHWLRLSGKLLSNLVFPLFWWLLLFREEIFGVVFSHRYPESTAIFAAAVLILPLRAYPFTALLQHYRRGDLINLGAILDLLLALALAPVFFRWMGLAGVAAAFSTATLALAIFYLAATARVSGLSILELIPVRTWVVRFGFSAAGMLVATLATPASVPPMIRLAVGGCIGLIIAVAGLRRDLAHKPPLP